MLREKIKNWKMELAAVLVFVLVLGMTGLSGSVKAADQTDLKTIDIMFVHDTHSHLNSFSTVVDEKQEMIGVCKPEESKMWFDKLWQNTVDLFRSLDIPVRTLECCSGDLADLKVKSIDVEAWSPRQKKYFEVGSCSNLGDAQARRLKIRVVGENGKYFAHVVSNVLGSICF